MALLTAAPRRVLALICVACVAMLAFAMYLQHVAGLEPCPMCVVQRYLLIFVALFAGIGALLGAGKRGFVKVMGFFVALSAFLGAFVAARQSWLQWNPPEFMTCGRDIYGMIESFPLARVVPMVFAGSGDCAAIDWTFLGLSIANWSFLAFVLFGVVGLALLFSKARRVL